MGKIVNKRELGELIGKSDTALTEWQNEAPPMPVVRRGGPGVAGEYDVGQVIEWMIDRALRRAVRESPKDRLDRVTADLRELELYKRRGELIAAAPLRLSLGRLVGEFRAALLRIATDPLIPDELRARIDALHRDALIGVSKYDPALFTATD